jgi:hypothetical protein
VSIPKGDYNYVRHQIFTSSDPSKIINVIVDHSWGTYFDGKLSSTDIKLQFAPIPHVSVVGRYNRNGFKGVGTGADKVNVDLYSIEGRFALNPRVQLIGFYQQNSDNNSKNYNIRLSWEYQPLSYVYVVFNRRGFNNISEPSDIRYEKENHVIAKISFLKQF